MQNRHLIFIGFMGTGKSTLGSELARIAGLPFIDLDVEIERIEGVSIAEIFELHGESYFRNLETERLRQLITSHDQPMVMATGGGAVLKEENRKLMIEHGFVVKTAAARDEIIRRLQNDRNLRPLLAGNLEERIDLLLLERETAYDFADYVIYTDQVERIEAINQVLTEWKENRA